MSNAYSFRTSRFSKTAYLALLSVCIFTLPSVAQASPIPIDPEQYTFTGLPHLTIGESQGFAFSGNGLVGGGQSVAGNTDIVPVIWQNGAVTQLGLLGGTTGAVFALSKDGSVAAGYSTTTTQNQTKAVIWKNGSVIDLGLPQGYDQSIAQYISDDGLTVSGVAIGGISSGTPIISNFIWHNGTTTLVPNINADFDLTFGLSGDGSTTIGYSMNFNSQTPSGYTYKNGVKTNLVSTATPNGFIVPFAVSYNGSKIAGGIQDGLTDFRAVYADNGVVTEVGGLGGVASVASAISKDGSIIAGLSDTATSTDIHLFTYKNNIMTDLGNTGAAVNGVANYFGLSMSDSGNVIVYNPGGGGVPYRWTEKSGLQTFTDALTQSGIDLTGWDLHDNTQTLSLFILKEGFTAVSDDGKYILGNGTFNGTATPYIMNSSGSGIITPEEVVQSLHDSGTGATQSQSAFSTGFSQTILAARQALSAVVTAPIVASADTKGLNGIETAAGGSKSLFVRNKWSSYVVGNLGFGQSNDFGSNTMSGATGIVHRLNDEVAVGAGIIAGRSNTDLHLGGSTQLTTSGASVLAAYEPNSSGLRLYGSAVAAYLDMDMNRRYLNGAAVDRSDSMTHGFGYGASTQAGWSVKYDEKTSVMPYIGLDASHTRLDGYQETGGGFAATVSDQTGHQATTHLGAEVSHQLADPLLVRGRVAWGHRISGAGGGITATMGPITSTVPYAQGDRDWAEFGTTAVYRLSDTASFIGDVSARAGETAEPAVSATVGLNIGF